MQGPPPMMQTMMRDRNRMLVAFLVALGLLLLMAGAIVTNYSYVSAAPNPDLRTVWGPSIMDVGIFLFVLGLIAGAMLLEDVDPFVRLFMLILAFVAILLILAKSPTIFG